MREVRTWPILALKAHDRGRNGSVEDLGKWQWWKRQWLEVEDGADALAPPETEWERKNRKSVGGLRSRPAQKEVGCVERTSGEEKGNGPRKRNSARKGFRYFWGFFEF